MTSNGNALRIRLKLDLRKDSTNCLVHGPLFHRWLPDGESDAITLLHSPGGAELRVWFDRLGFVDDKFIQFDPERREVDPEVMACQGLLDAGPLNVELQLVGINDEEMAALRGADFCHGRTDPEPLYEALGKRVSKLIGPPIHKFTQLLAISYGQYWLQPWPPYDSTQHATLGSYFRTCRAEWESDTDEKWTPFLPSRLDIHYSSSGIPSCFDEYLNEEDWRRLAQLTHSKEEPRLAAQCIALVNELVGEDRLRHALIECVTAFEIAFAERVTRRVESGSEPKTNLDGASNQLRMQCILGFVDSVPPDEIQLASEAIKERNALVHEAKTPSDLSRTKRRIEAMLRVCRALLDHHVVRLPRLTSGNVLKPIERWEAESAKGK